MLLFDDDGHEKALEGTRHAESHTSREPMSTRTCRAFLPPSSAAAPAAPPWARAREPLVPANAHPLKVISL